MPTRMKVTCPGCQRQIVVRLDVSRGRDRCLYCGERLEPDGRETVGGDVLPCIRCDRAIALSGLETSHRLRCPWCGFEYDRLGADGLDLDGLRTYARLRARRARVHHYQFAHRWLPANFLARPASLLGAIGGDPPAARRWIASGWTRVGELLPEDLRLPAEGLAIGRVDVEGLPTLSLALVIRLPQPVAVPEAHLAALVIQHPPGGALPIEEWMSRQSARYYTLEYGLELTGRETPTLCEWVLHPEAGLRHVHHGDGSPPEPSLLIEAILDLEARRLNEARARARREDLPEEVVHAHAHGVPNLHPGGWRATTRR